MQFFEYQDEARGRTTLLVWLFVFAVIALVGTSCVATHFVLLADSRYTRPLDSGALDADHWLWVSVAGLGTLGVILLGAGYRMAQLRGGGYKVAESLGGSLISPATTDLLERRAINVVEEMAIASGVPVPEIYVLEQETAINAFAAGHTPANAAVAVTQGA
ncbi:MAG TPA: M48 family metalloprotease, partial [Polyangiaceae bacterium]|nr:M48 family metalloprotease [Polyangiaceae bacterium]